MPSPRDSKPATGVYVVALTDELDSTGHALAICPISFEALSHLLSVRSELTLDGVRPQASALGERLSAFWLSDEVVLYIGKTDRTLPKRLLEYYQTPLGARSPHAGGWPLKVLACLSELYVHYAYSELAEEAERAMLEAFAANVSSTARNALHDPVNVMPFANLEVAHGRRKKHGIEGAKAPRRP